MIFSSGIGTYIQKIVPRLEKTFSLTLLVRKADEIWVKEHFSSLTYPLEASIYTVKEQLAYPFCIPKCDLFWSPHYNIPLLPIKAKKRITTIHDVCHLSMPEFFPKWKRSMAFFLLKEAVKKSDLILTISDFSSEEIIKHLPSSKAKIRVVANGVNKCDVGSIRDLGIKEPFILYVGNNKPHKNVGRLLEAFFLLPACYHLVMVSSLKGFFTIPNHPRITVLQKISTEELFSLFQKAKLLIQPSLYEGFGLPPLEAMSVGCPVVASYVASLPKVCGAAAHYVDPYRVESLYEGMKEVLENLLLRKRLIRAGYEQQKNFSWDKAADQIEKLFLEQAYS